MTIDKKLQKECYNKAIKKVAKNYELTQKYVRDLSGPRSHKDRLRDVSQFAITNAVKNWTVEYYNKEMQARYLPLSK